MLQVGPQSAGAEPGPRLLRPRRHAADDHRRRPRPRLPRRRRASWRGELGLDRAAARRAIEEHVARPLGISLEQAAAGIYDVVNVTMATGVREVSVRRGLDPRDFPLVVAGGAGPIHAAAIAARARDPAARRPARVLDLLRRRDAHVRLQARFRAGLQDAARRARRAAARGAAAGDGAGGARRVLERERVDPARVEVRAALDLRYVGQWHELTVAGRDDRPGGARGGFPRRARPALRLRVARRCRSRRWPSACRALGLTTKPALRELAPAAGGEAPALRGARPVWSPAERELRETPVYDGPALGARVGGCGSGGRRAREHDDRRPRRLRPVGRPLRRVRARLR